MISFLFSFFEKEHDQLPFLDSVCENIARRAYDLQTP